MNTPKNHPDRLLESIQVQKNLITQQLEEICEKIDAAISRNELVPDILIFERLLFQSKILSLDTQAEALRIQIHEQNLKPSTEERLKKRKPG